MAILVLQKENMLRLNSDAFGRHCYLLAVQFPSCRENKGGLELTWFPVRCEQACPVRVMFKNTVLRPLGAKQPSSNTPGVHVWFSYLLPRIEPKMRLRFRVHAVPVCAFCGSQCCLAVSSRSPLGPVSSRGPRALARGGDHSVMTKTGERRIRARLDSS